MTLCIFFDIDGTLIETGGAGRSAFRKAVCETLDVNEDLRHISFAGATDLGLFHALCATHSRTTTPELEKRFFNLLHKHLEQTLNADRVELLPGVRDLLEHLAECPGVELALLTGNAATCARLKLAPHDLNRFFAFGAFGDEHALRADIARCAQQRARERLGDNVGCHVVGDTPQDIAAARAIGAPCLAVATGRYTAEELAAASADAVFHDLTQIHAIVDCLCVEPAANV